MEGAHLLEIVLHVLGVVLRDVLVLLRLRHGTQGNVIIGYKEMSSLLQKVVRRNGQLAIVNIFYLFCFVFVLFLFCFCFALDIFLNVTFLIISTMSRLWLRMATLPV